MEPRRLQLKLGLYRGEGEAFQGGYQDSHVIEWMHLPCRD